MRSFLSIATALLGAVAFASAADAESDVHSLTKDTFSDFIKGHDLVLAEFFAPWCGHCKALAPEYETAATELKEKNIALVKVDCTAEAELCKEYGVEGYPTLKIFRGEDNVKPYPGARKSGALVSYMIKQSLPAVSPVTEANLEEFKTLDKIVIVGYIPSDSKKVNEVFNSLAESERDNFLFGASDDAAVAKAEEVEQPSIVLYKDFDEKKAVYTGPFDSESILAWITTASTPLVGEVGPETYAKYMKAGIPLAYIFAETPEEREQFAEEFRPIAEQHRGKINIATIDAKAFGAHAGNLNLDPSIFPAFAIQDPEKNTKFPWDQTKDIKAKEIGEFIQDVLDGKVSPSIKSEPIPETQEGPVTVVVAHTYQELVIDSDKDVLLEFYAPWCGHCKALAPKYEQLASIYAENPEYASKVTVAKIDATANDIPDAIQGFPTIKLYPAGSKDAPVEYSGSRTVEDLAEFIKTKGKHQVDAVSDIAKSNEEAAASSAAASSASASASASASSAAEAAAASETGSAAPEATEEAAPEHDEL
ncbi:protein disulfide isomerase Pdi1, putative [Talaromyces stipitatus ATCC 10500]|uniref:Protein disulfide-isomerase n=1 Tax=Talaromyces stipitatus (strain ATCC 10500 / CBS 375.48 / QM 6759 / NRRL 1006) TaxID=441959 RepID=B8LT84_TALSN|nr:protein disulfide isomerase Pdi1, putative [Talaromyces stipitatus ATCC 10500]EED23592.1 protein disulfide isomerase Pdi1, putative [Talaromyces stipitatus ATCC 10500]